MRCLIEAFIRRSIHPSLHRIGTSVLEGGGAVGSIAVLLAKDTLVFLQFLQSHSMLNTNRDSKTYILTPASVLFTEIKEKIIIYTFLC